MTGRKPMSKSSALRLRDVRHAYRLIGDCRDLGADPVLWHGRMLEGLVSLIGATAATGGEGRWRRPGGWPLPASAFSAGLDVAARGRYRAYVQAGSVKHDPVMKALSDIPGGIVAHTRRELVPDGDWYRSALFNDNLKVLHLNHCLYSICRTSEEHAISGVALYRGLGERDFSDRDRQLLRFFHGELGRLVGSSLASVFDPDPLQLPRREKETLACLLEGDSEKQVAARLGVSYATTHEYVKSLYRRFGVRSRGELLAYLLRRQRTLLRSNVQARGLP
jgi:DNA-binding CsgD family transcriptional regulator